MSGVDRLKINKLSEAIRELVEAGATVTPCEFGLRVDTLFGEGDRRLKVTQFVTWPQEVISD